MDYIRIDLYSVGDKVYFGETTLYPIGGIGRFEPRDRHQQYDEFFGSKWNIMPVLEKAKKSYQH